MRRYFQNYTPNPQQVLRHQLQREQERAKQGQTDFPSQLTCLQCGGSLQVCYGNRHGTIVRRCGQGHEEVSRRAL